MKKKETVKKETKTKEGKMTLEKLARMMAQGFEKVREEMVSKDEFKTEVILLKQGQAKLEKGQEEIKEEVEGIKEELASVKEDQKDNTRRLISIERKLAGTLISLDETVHRSEFNKLARRVEVLEA